LSFGDLNSEKKSKKKDKISVILDKIRLRPERIIDFSKKVKQREKSPLEIQKLEISSEALALPSLLNSYYSEL
jgi:mevalonate pyrophosphate decarboxylase